MAWGSPGPELPSGMVAFILFLYPWQVVRVDRWCELRIMSEHTQLPSRGLALNFWVVPLLLNESNLTEAGDSCESIPTQDSGVSLLGPAAFLSLTLGLDCWCQSLGLLCYQGEPRGL